MSERQEYQPDDEIVERLIEEYSQQAAALLDEQRQELERIRVKYESHLNGLDPKYGTLALEMDLEKLTTMSMIETAHAEYIKKRADLLESIVSRLEAGLARGSADKKEKVAGDVKKILGMVGRASGGLSNAEILADLDRREQLWLEKNKPKEEF